MLYATDMKPNRFPKSVFEQGREPDPRFSLANERTFLAWVRTSLALILAGPVIEVLGVPANEPLRLLIAVVFMAMGIFASLWAWLGWMATERALRLGKPLTGLNVAPILTILIALAASMMILGLLNVT